MTATTTTTSTTMERPQLWEHERRFWLADRAFYERSLSADCLMVFAPPAGVLDRARAIEGIAQGQRWESVEMTDRREVALGDGTILLVYRATAQRAGAAYRALASSLYRRGADGALLLAFHQQTPA